MDTDTIASLANLDGVGDRLDLQSILRNLVISEFFMDIGEVAWRNVVSSVALVAADRQKDLPDDFWAMKTILIPPTGVTVLDSKQGELTFIGEDVSAMLAAEVNTQQNKPTAYWITSRAGTSGDPGVGSFRAVRFNAPSDGSYTVSFIYERGPVFEDLQANVDLDTWIPSIVQPAIVAKLRAHVLKDRFGQNDPRFEIATAEYNGWIEKILDRGGYQARRNYAKYVS